MREKLVAAGVVSLFAALAACSNGGGSGPGGGGGTGGIDNGPCAGIERVCTSPDECPSLQTCSGCGACVVDTGLRACEDTSDCPIGRACRVPEGATEKACVRVLCDTHDQCAEGEACDADRHACIPGDCVALGCPEGTYCREEDARCVECVGDQHCLGTPKPYCIEERSICVVCEIDSDCGPGGRCSNYECVSCVENADCAAPNRFCRNDGMCVSCLSNADCPGVACLEDGRCDLGPIAGEACNPGRSCAPGYRCEGSGTGTCFLACNPYAPVCGNNEFCQIMADANGQAVMDGTRPAGICVRDSGGRIAGEVCDATHDCRADLVCLPDGPTTTRCRLPCDPVAGTTPCATGEVCESLALGANGAPIGFCMLPTTFGDPCQEDEDCDVGQGCTMAVDGDQLVYTCGYTTGTKAELQPCTADTQCRSGFCINRAEGQPGFCHGACETTADCAGGLCTHVSFTLAEGGTATGLGCVPACDNDADCTRYGSFVCGIAFDDVDLQLFGECSARAGAANAGEACTSDAACAGSWCLAGDATGFCVGACDTNADCGGGLQCRTVAFGVSDTAYDNVDVCWGASCGRDADCPTDWTCAFEANPASPTSSIQFSCHPGYGDLPAGSSCAAGSECRSGQCVGGTCFGTCLDDTDCAGDTYCWPGAYSYTTEDGTVVQIDGCMTWW